MIQDIAPAAFDGAFHDRTPEDGSPIFCFWKNTVLLGNDNTLPTYAQLRPHLTDTTYLFAIDQVTYYLGTVPNQLSLPGFAWLPHRTLRKLTPIPKHWPASPPGICHTGIETTGSAAAADNL